MESRAQGRRLATTVLPLVIVAAGFSACGRADEATNVSPLPTRSASTVGATEVPEQPLSTPSVAPTTPTKAPTPTPLPLGDDALAASDDDGTELADSGAPGPSTTAPGELDVLPAPQDGFAPTPLPGLDPDGPVGAVVTYTESASYGEDVEPQVLHHQVLTMRDGSFSVADDQGSESRFDDASGRRYYAFTYDNDRSASLESELSVGAPDPYGSDYVIDSGLAQYVASLHPEHPALSPTQVAGRPGRRYETDLVRNAIGGGPDHAVIVIDDETGLPLAYESTLEGRPYRSITVEELTPLDSDNLAGGVGLTIPDDAGEPLSAGYERVALDEVEAMIGRPAPVPAVVPEGFVLDAAAVLVGEGSWVTGAEGSNPWNTDVVALRYRNGWQTFTVTTRVAVGGPSQWSDPFRGEGSMYPSSPVTLAAGSLAGSHGEVVYTPEVTPSLWTVNADLVLTVTGSLTAHELVAIAESV